MAGTDDEDDDPRALRRRIEELEAELAAAQRDLAELRALRSENEELRRHVEDLQSELLSLSPPPLPKFSFPVGPVSRRPSGSASFSEGGVAKHAARGAPRGSVSQVSLIVILVAVLLAWIPFILSWIEEGSEGAAIERASERGLGDFVPPSRATERETDAVEEGASSVDAAETHASDAGNARE